MNIYKNLEGKSGTLGIHIESPVNLTVGSKMNR